MDANALQDFFVQHRRQLSSFIYRMINDVDLAQDILQDTMVAAVEKYDQFKGDSSLKTWIFSIASRKTIDLLRKEKRWSENVMDQAKSAAIADPDFIGSMQQLGQTSPQGRFEVIEHIELCFRCISKTLLIEEQLSLMLKDIFDFKVKEIATILEKSQSQVKHYLEDARAAMIEIYDRRCALINKQGTCHQCSELLGVYNPSKQARQKLMQLRLVVEAADKTKEELYALRNDLIKSIDPLTAEGHEFQEKHMTFICQVAKGLGADG